MVRVYNVCVSLSGCDTDPYGVAGLTPLMSKTLLGHRGGASGIVKHL